MNMPEDKKKQAGEESEMIPDTQEELLAGDVDLDDAQELGKIPKTQEELLADDDMDLGMDDYLEADDALVDGALEDDNEPEEDEAEDIAALKAEAADFKDKLLRAMAETENIRRRAERERDSVSKYAIANFARDMLQVNSNLHRALESVSEEGREGSEEIKNLIVGIEMTEREMMNAFERAGIKPIDAMGQKFDPNFHEAMFEIEDKSLPIGTVVQVVEQGYLIYDRSLRPARVGVSKGGEKAVSEEKAEVDVKTGTSSKGQAAYEKQVDAKSDKSGSQVDKEL